MRSEIDLQINYHQYYDSSRFGLERIDVTKPGCEERPNLSQFVNTIRSALKYGLLMLVKK